MLAGAIYRIHFTNNNQNMTGPGRPGREDQASLTAMATAAMDWDYGTLLPNILASAQLLSTFRTYRSPFYIWVVFYMYNKC